MDIMITGASKGIGFELVKYFAQLDHTRIFALSGNPAIVKKALDEGLKKSATAAIFVIDFSAEQFLGAPELIAAHLGKSLFHLDVLINNAGSLINKPFIGTTLADLKGVFQVNTFMPAILIQQLLPFMGKAGGTHVVNISSMGGYQGSVKFPGLSLYSASKAALACLTECLQEEFKNSSVTFNCLAIGSVQTEMLQQAFPGYQAPVKASEMAKFIGDFALNAHKYIKGKIIPVSVSTP
jgi:NAD(P)-dependent dehydrogenase (short-subunit alcohol dehydrogenase family)